MNPRLLAFCLVVVVGTTLPGTLGCGQGTGTASGEGREIVLPPPVTEGGMSVPEAIAKRRSVRQFTQEALTLEQISQLAWAAQGITDPVRQFRAAPSAGATYPLELYLFTAEGVFRYVPKDHKLVQLGAQDRRRELAAAALGQDFVRQAPLDFVITAIYERTSARYGGRAERYVHMEIGHVAENILLQAVALGLGAVPVGALREQAISDLLDLPSGETPLYIVPVGHPQ
jgi:SagB-type dehydrogenase family enzyme